MTHAGDLWRPRTISLPIAEGLCWLGFLGPCGASAAAASDRSSDGPWGRLLSLDDELRLLGLDVFPHDDER